MASDEQSEFEQQALEEAAAKAAAAATEEEETREVHPDSPELVTPEALAEAAEETAEEVPAEEPAAEEPAAEEPVTPVYDQHYQQPTVPPGYVPVQALDARLGRQQQQYESRIAELTANLDAVKQYVEQQQAERAAAEQQSSIPPWEKDPIGHLRATVSQGVLGDLSPRLERLESTLGKLDTVIGQTEEQQKARATEQTLRQAYSMQERTAMTANPEADAAIRHFHQQRTAYHMGQGYDASSASSLADEDRFNLYKGGGAADGPAALVTMYRNLGINPVDAWGQLLQAQQQQPVQQGEVPSQPAAVPPAMPQVPAGPRRLEEPPPPVRRRRPSESESTAWNYLMHHYDEIPEDQIDKHIRKYAQEEDIPLREAYGKVLQERQRRIFKTA